MKRDQQALWEPDASEAPVETPYTIVGYGAGTNSTAILVGLQERGLRPDGIVFADTGGEKPETYAHLHVVNAWCQSVGFPEIEVVKGAQPQMLKDGSLQAECHRLGALPSKAFGYSSCSMKWKIAPQMLSLQAWSDAKGIPLSDVTRLVGFDADEWDRVERGMRASASRPYRQRYPLYEWDWGREECVAAIARAGLPQPGKSACYFCPSSKKHEILMLRQNHPELLADALLMERRALAGEGQAEAAQVAGLGRHFNWAKFLADYDSAVAKGAAFLAAQRDLLSDAGTPEADCACSDGEVEPIAGPITQSDQSIEMNSSPLLPPKKG